MRMIMCDVGRLILCDDTDLNISIVGCCLMPVCDQTSAFRQLLISLPYESSSLFHHISRVCAYFIVLKKKCIFSFVLKIKIK